MVFTNLHYISKFDIPFAKIGIRNNYSQNPHNVIVFILAVSVNSEVTFHQSMKQRTWGQELLLNFQDKPKHNYVMLETRSNEHEIYIIQCNSVTVILICQHNCHVVLVNRFRVAKWLVKTNTLIWVLEVCAHRPVADPGFSRGGGPTLHLGRGRQHKILPKFPKNCMKSKEFGPGGYVTADTTVNKLNVQGSNVHDISLQRAMSEEDWKSPHQK